MAVPQLVVERAREHDQPSKARAERSKASDFCHPVQVGANVASIPTLIMNPRVERVGARLNMRFGISVEKKILGAFVAGGALLIAAAWFAVASSRAYLDSDARGDRLRLAWSATAELFSTLQDAELGARVYAFAGDIASLQTYATS